MIGRRGKALIIVYVAFLAVLLLMCSTDLIIREPEREVYQVAVIIEDMRSDNYSNFRKGMDQAAMEFNVDVHFITLYEKLDAAQQMELMEREEQDGADALVVVPADEGQGGNAGVQLPAPAHGGGDAALGDLVDHVVQLVPQEDGDDSRRSLLASQAVLVARTGGGLAQQIRVDVHGLYHAGEHQQKL